jgi:hypothetical protein
MLIALRQALKLLSKILWIDYQIALYFLQAPLQAD